MKPRTVWRCQFMVCMISVMVAPFLRCNMAIAWAILLPSRGALASGCWRDFLALAVDLAEVAVLLVWRGAGAPLAAPAPALPFVAACAFVCGVTGAGSDSALTLGPSFAARSQILAAARWESASRLRGFTPGRLL